MNRQSNSEIREYTEKMLKERCYICGRTPDEVKDFFFTEYVEGEDPPLMYLKDAREGNITICRGCKGLIETVSSDDLFEDNFLDEYVDDRIEQMLNKIRNAINTIIGKEK